MYSIANIRYQIESRRYAICWRYHESNTTAGSTHPNCICIAELEPSQITSSAFETFITVLP